MIRAGDKVMVTYGNCAHAVAFIGETTTVLRVREGRAYCTYCGVNTPRCLHAEVEIGDTIGPWPLAWLRKLDDPTEDVTREERQEVEA